MKNEILKFDRIKALRESNGITKAKIAEFLCISPSTYARYEQGKCKVPTRIIINLAQLHNISIDYLLERTNNPAPYLSAKKIE